MKILPKIFLLKIVQMFLRKIKLICPKMKKIQPNNLLQINILQILRKQAIKQPKLITKPSHNQFKQNPLQYIELKMMK